MAKKNIADKYWIYGEDAELAARLTSYLTRVVYNQRANYIRALMKIKEHECSIEDCDSDIESQSMRSGNSLEESIESKLMWEAIRKYLPKRWPTYLAPAQSIPAVATMSTVSKI